METNDRTDQPTDAATTTRRISWSSMTTRRIRELLKQYLTENGFRVTAAGNAAEARRKLDGLDFDLLDRRRDDARRKRHRADQGAARDKTVPILMLTALAETDSRIAGPGSRRRRLSAEAVRSARTDAAHQQHPARAAARQRRPKVEQVVFGPYTFQIASARTEAGRRAVAADRPRAGDHGDFRRARRRDHSAPRAGRRRGRGRRAHHRRADQPPAPQDRGDPSNPIWLQTVRGIGYRLSVD